MKKILSIFILIGFVILNACDPMEDIYDELDAAEDPVNAEVSFTLTSDDYEAIVEYVYEDVVTAEDSSNADLIEELEAFNKFYGASDYIPFLLADKYAVLNDGSIAVISYNEYLGIEYLDNVGDPDDEYELIAADYDAMGEGTGEPGEYNNFSSSAAPEDYLPDYLLTLYPDAEEGYMVIITYKYYSGTTSNLEGYLYFDGTEWMMLSNSYELVDADYDEMGPGPGQYNNFSSSAAPEDYLPIWLKINNPYDVSGTVRTIIYKYYSSGTTYTRAQEYHYDGSSWIQYDAIVETTNQFIHNGEGWVFDPTERVEMVGADYQTIVEYVKENHAADDASTYDDSEYYYGASYYYNNFDLRNFNAEVFDSWEEAIEEAIGTILLPELYPNATLQVNGVDMGYRVVFKTYDGTNGTYSMKFQVTKAGPDPEFTLVEGPIME